MSGDLNRTDCAFVDRWLDDWLAGRLAGDIARRVDEHVAGCERCRQLTAIVAAGEAGANETAEDDALLSAVLSRTIGSPCARAETLLPALVDEELEGDSREILQAHLAHCDGCSRLLAALQEARRVLPALVEIEPPLGFAERVLRATTAVPPRPAFGGAAWEWTLRILARPRASLELAYVATVLLVVLLGNPVAAFYQAEQRATELAGAVPVAQFSEQLGVKDAAAGTLGRVVAGIASLINAVQSEVAARWNQARAVLEALETAIGNGIAWLANLDVRQLLGGGAPAQPRGQPTPTEPGTRR